MSFHKYHNDYFTAMQFLCQVIFLVLNYEVKKFKKTLDKKRRQS